MILDCSKNGGAARAYAYACRLCARRDYTAHEIRTKLKLKKYDEEVIGKVVDRFIELKFLDDEAYVGKYIRTRIALNPRGEYMLKMELRKKGVSDDLVEEYFSKNAIDEAKIAEDLIKRNARKLRKFPKAERKKKIIRLLRSRGVKY